MTPLRIPPGAVIPREKLTNYLLAPRRRDDKSRFLGAAGFTRGDPDHLEAALRALVAETDAVEDGTNEYGTFLRVEGQLVGRTGRSLSVVTIWLRRKADDAVQFITLKPLRRKLRWA